MKVDAILPAGGRISGDFAREAGTPIKALIEINGQTILERTIAALRETERVARIVVIGPPELQGHAATRDADAVLPEVDDKALSGPSNIFRGLDHLRGEDEHKARVLVVTTDLPFLNAASVTDFLDRCPPKSDISLPIIRREEYLNRFPSAVGFFVPLRDGRFTLGCAFLVNSAAMARNRVHIDAVFAARKSPFAMARLLGPFFIARFLVRRLTTVHIQERCERVLGCRGAAVLNCAPELAFDIDLPSELQHARRFAEA